MKAVQCPNKHFYDADLFSECPHCKMSKGGAAPAPAAPQPPRPAAPAPNARGRGASADTGKGAPQKWSFLTEQVSEPEPAPESRRPAPPVMPNKRSDLLNPVYVNDEDTPTVALFALMDDSDLPATADNAPTPVRKAPEPSIVPPRVNEYPETTAPRGRGKSPASDAPKSKRSRAKAREEAAAPPKPAPAPAPAPTPAPTPVPAPEPVSQQKEQTSLQREVSATMATSITTDFKTVGFFQVQEDVEPVVGWLVCISGAHLGDSFKIKSGKNCIGRDADMDISLAKETTVSRNRQALLIFDPVHSKFVLQSGEGKGLTYLNDELVVTYQPLKDRDIIGLGKAKFLFVALCGDSFSWDTYINS